MDKKLIQKLRRQKKKKWINCSGDTKISEDIKEKPFAKDVTSSQESKSSKDNDKDLHNDDIRLNFSKDCGVSNCRSGPVDETITFNKLMFSNDKVHRDSDPENLIIEEIINSRSFNVDDGHFSIFVLDHRRYSSEDELIAKAKGIISQETKFYCLVMIFKPINKRRTAQENNKRYKSLIEKITSQLLFGIDKNEVRRLILVEVSMIILSCTERAGGKTMLSSINADLPSGLIDKLKSIPDLLKSMVYVYGGHNEKNVTCNCHSYQSKECAFFIMFIVGLKEYDIEVLRGLISMNIPKLNMFLIIIQANEDGRCHITVGNLMGESYDTYILGQTKAIFKLKILLGETFDFMGPKVLSNDVKVRVMEKVDVASYKLKVKEEKVKINYTEKWMKITKRIYETFQNTMISKSISESLIKKDFEEARRKKQIEDIVRDSNSKAKKDKARNKGHIRLSEEIDRDMVF